MEGEKYIAALDVGTSTVVCIIFNSKAEVIGKSTGNVTLLFPQPGHVEINPDELWDLIVNVIRNAIEDSGVHPSKISSLGLSTQRGSFITWDRRTGRHYHNFITWKDLRADKLVNSWNRSLTLKVINSGGYLLYLFSRSKRFLAASVLKFANSHITIRLLWALEHIPALRSGVAAGTALFGSLDTWLLYRLSGGRCHVSDASSASATGMYDPFTCRWAGWALTVFSIPKEILPEVVDSAGDFGCVDEAILGWRIPINASLADQSASMWGSCCFSPGSVKLTMGTGSFLDINTGSRPHASLLGLYPLIAWRHGADLVYMVEGGNNDTGTLVQWAINAGLIDTPEETSALADMVDDSDGVFFVPAFSGLGAPINDTTAGAGFIGMKLTTKREHLIRALLEAIVFRAVQLYNCTRKETSFKLHNIRVDGGVSQNDFVSQLISDMTGLRIERTDSKEISALGCAYLAGLSCGVWSSKEEICALHKVVDIFKPREYVGQSYISTMSRWQDAVQRFTGWYHSPAQPPKRAGNSVAPRGLPNGYNT